MNKTSHGKTTATRQGTDLYGSCTLHLGSRAADVATPHGLTRETAPRRIAQQGYMAAEHVLYTDVSAGKTWRGGGFAVVEVGCGGRELRRDGEGSIAGIETLVVGRSWVPWAPVE